jgi:VanZ family protein
LIDPFFRVAHRPWLRAGLAWTVTVGWALLIFCFSTTSYRGDLSAWLLREALRILHLQLPAGAFNLCHFVIRKCAHLSEYAAFAVFLYWALESPRTHSWRLRLATASVLLAGMYSLTDEYHQSLVPGRTPSLVDCGIDTLGATLGMLVLFRDTRLIQARASTPAAARASTVETKNGAAGE